MSYFLAPALVALRDEINKAFPRRDKTSDGWIGDPSHAARVSDHNPDWRAGGRLYGVVRAIDIDIDDNDPTYDLRREILNAAIGDRRVWYVISNGIIYSRTHNWVALPYTGTNPHTHHVHISLRHNYGEFDTSAWLPKRPKFKPQVVKLDRVRDDFLAAATGKKVSEDVHVKRVQKALNHKYGLTLATDGVVGKATLDAWGRHEGASGGSGRPRVPDKKSLRALVGDAYFVDAA